MKPILCTCALFLVLPWKLTGETTFRPSSTMEHEDSKNNGSTIRSNELKISMANGKKTHSQTSIGQHEVTLTNHETTLRSASSTLFSPKNTEHHLKLNGETTYSQTSTKLHEVTFKGNKTTIRSSRSTQLSPNNLKLNLKPNGETNHSQTSTTQYEDPSNKTTNRNNEPTIYTTENITISGRMTGTGLHKGHETTTSGYKPTSSFLHTEDEYTTQESKNVLSSTLPPQTSEHQHATSMSNAENPTYAVTSSRGESRSTSQQSSLSSTAETTHQKTDQITITVLTQKMSDEVITSRNVHQSFNSTSKHLGIYNHENQTTRAGETETSKQHTEMSTHFQKTLEVIASTSGVEVKTTGTVATKWSSLPQEKESTHLPTVTDSNKTLDISKDKRKDTATYPLNTSTTTEVSTHLRPNDTEGGTASTDTTNTKTTYEITKDTAGERKSSPESKTIPITEKTTSSFKTTTPKLPIKDNNNSHPGRIVAALISTILCLMFIAFVVILVKNRQRKKKQLENPDWAGPSPFIEADVHPHVTSSNEDGSFHHPESKRISLHSFLPQRISKRFSMLSPTEEEIPLEHTQSSSTFGQHNVQPLNGNAAQEQSQKAEENSPPANVTSDTSVPETVNNSPATENNSNIQTTTKLDEVVPSPPAETDSATPSTFEDVDLNLSPEKNTESTSPSDAMDITSPPLAPP